MAGCHLVEHGAETEDVRPHIEIFAAGLFRRHVGQSAEDHPGDRQVCGCGGCVRSGRFRQSEIQYPGRTLNRDEDVCRLDVAMNNSLLIRGIQRARNLDCQVQEFCRLQGLAGDAMLQGIALEILHHNERLAMVFADFVDGADVRMVEGGSSPSFALEACQSLTIAAPGLGEEFEGDEPVEACIQGLINHTHPAGAQPFDDPVVRNSLA